MIRKIISEIEFDLKYQSGITQSRLDAINSVKNLLNQIDFDVEIVQLVEVDSLYKLFISLKGEELKEEEKKLLREIVEKNY